MKRKSPKSLFGRALLALLPLDLFGCGVGDAPAPMSDADVKTAIDKMSPEQRIHFIQGSPLPQAEKDKQIKEIKEKNGIK